MFQSPDSNLIEYRVGAGILTIGNLGEAFQPSSQGAFIALEVDDFESEVARVSALGVNIVAPHVELPTSVFAIILDPDGTRSCYTKPSPSPDLSGRVARCRTLPPVPPLARINSPSQPSRSLPPPAPRRPEAQRIPTARQLAVSIENAIKPHVRDRWSGGAHRHQRHMIQRHDVRAVLTAAGCAQREVVTPVPHRARQ